jgi:hypothetical protein
MACLGCIFLQESSGFLCFPFLWRFFHRNHDSSSAATFSEHHQETCLYGVYVGSYVGLKKELSIWCVPFKLQPARTSHITKKMNHKSCSGTTITSSNTTDNSIYEGDNTPISLVIQVSYENEGCALFAEALLWCIGLQFPYAHIGHELAPTLCIQTHISHALAPTLCPFLQQAKTPCLGYIGVPPPPRGSCSMSENGYGGSD